MPASVGRKSYRMRLQGHRGRRDLNDSNKQLAVRWIPMDDKLWPFISVACLWMNRFSAHDEWQILALKQSFIGLGYASCDPSPYISLPGTPGYGISFSGSITAATSSPSFSRSPKVSAIEGSAPVSFGRHR